MSSEKNQDPWAEEVKAVAEESRQRLDEHPEPASLIAYQAGELGDEASRRLQRHLALCPECVRTLLDLDVFPDLESEVAANEGERAASWEVVSAGLEKAAASTSADGVSTSVVRARLPRGYLALVAALLVAALGLGGWGLSLRHQLATLLAPEGNVLVHDLLPASEGGTRSLEGEEVRLSPGTERLVLILNLEAPHAFAEYRVHILDDQQGVHWRVGGLQPTPEGSLSLSLPRPSRFLGRLRLELYGMGEAGPERLVSYPVTVVHATGP